MDVELQKVEHAAFQVGPLDGLTLLAARLEDLSGNDLHARWLRGVCLGAVGRYGEAFDVLEAAAEAGRAWPGPDRWSSLAWSTLGSLHRQLGLHAAARECDVEAFAIAPDDDAEPIVEARLGLAADAVGLGEVDEAAGHHELAMRVLAAAPGAGWRVRVRADWVAAEVALLRGRPGQALKPAAMAISMAERAGAPRHVAKSLLFGAVARAMTGSPGMALDDASRAFDLGVRLGTLPLVWPAAGLLTDPYHGLVQMLSPSRRGEVLEQAAYAVQGIAVSLPADLARGWRSAPDVHALLERAGVVPPS